MRFAPIRPVHILAGIAFLFCCGLDLKAQSSSAKRLFPWQGKVIDSVTQMPIAQVYVWAGGRGTATDFDGNFILMVSSSDTVHITHVSYHEQHISGLSLNQPVNIRLSPKNRMLNEVRVLSYLSERNFKDQIIATKTPETREEEIAKLNSRIISYVAKIAPQAPMTAYQNYRDYMNGPQGVTILSTSSSKGLVGVVKKFVSEIKIKKPYEKLHTNDSVAFKPRH